MVSIRALHFPKHWLLYEDNNYDDDDSDEDEDKYDHNDDHEDADKGQWSESGLNSVFLISLIMNNE